MADIPEGLKRRMLSDELQDSFKATIGQRVDRYLEVSPQPFTPNPHFAAASAECIHLYTDGYFISTVMVTQAVAEGIRNFVVERNKITGCDNMKGPEVDALLVSRGLISQNCADAFERIWKSFRNDVHHMNPNVAKIHFPTLAKRNIKDLAAIEQEIFASQEKKGKFFPLNPMYWNIDANGAVRESFLRFEP